MAEPRKPLLTQRTLLLVFVAPATAVAAGTVLRLVHVPIGACLAGGVTAFLATLRALHDLVA